MQILYAIIDLLCFVIFAIVSGAIICGLYYIANLENLHHNSSSSSASYVNNIPSESDIKGALGESYVNNILIQYESKGYKILRNVYLKKRDGATTEIDLLLITDRNIIIFESKNYSGWIFGNDNSDYWTQCLPAGRTSLKTKFYNPIKQNNLHCAVLRYYVSSSIHIHSVVCFGDDCTFKDVSIGKSNCIVCHYSDIENVVNRLLEHDAESKLDTTKIFSKLVKFTNVPESIRQKHIRNINSRHTKNTIGFK